MSEREQLLTTFLELQKALSFLSEKILNDTHLVGWLDHFPLSPSPQEQLLLRQEAITAIHQLEYQDGQNSREILIRPGFLGASEETLLAVSDVNLKKEKFKQAVLALKTAKIPLKCPMLQELFENILPSRATETNIKLRKYGLARLHLKQCYRTLPILSHAPVHISWTWTNTRSIKRINQEEARLRLTEIGHDSGIVSQLQKLKQLETQEILAILQEPAPYLRANICLLDERLRKYWVTMNAPIPIFFPANTNTPCPVFKPLKSKQGRNPHKPRRVDMKIEVQPYLPAIRAHRYIQANT